MSNPHYEQSRYIDDERVTPTTRGVALTFNDQTLYVRPDPDNAMWIIVDADGNSRGFSRGTLDDAVGFFLGEPQSMAAAS